MRGLASLIVAAAFACSTFTPCVAVEGASPLIILLRATGPIVVDGDISDAAWRDAVPIDVWYETNPGDSIPPKVASVGRLAYDDKYLYAAFDFADPNPDTIRAPFSDRDNVEGTTDHGGLVLDPEHDRKTAILFLANPRGIQYDSMYSDTNGSEDSAPDWFWDSAAKMDSRGWTMEIRIPFSSLRYPSGDPQTWGIMLYRNWPRDRRYQMFTAKLPRDSGCFICNEQDLTGLEGLPTGGDWVVAPYGVAHSEGTPSDGLGSSLTTPAADLEAGLDAKWTPDAVTSIDLTANPFFLEGVDLLTTPIPAVHTRTITAPTVGTRATGKMGSTSYTALAVHDEGGGLVVIPGTDGSDFGAQDFQSFVGIARARHDIGSSFISGLFTDREVAGGGYNRVVGPDFQWRPKDSDVVTGQLLFSDTKTPDRGDDPFAPAEWDGRRMRSHAGELWYQHTDARFDWFFDFRDYGDGFRADNGFVPQVGFREYYASGGWTRHPEQGFLSRQRVFLETDYTEDREGRLFNTFIAPGVGMDGKANSSLRFWIVEEHLRAISDFVDGEPVFRLLPRRRFRFITQASPWPWLTNIGLEGAYGSDVDFSQARPGHGGQLTLRATVRPSDHIALVLLADRRWLDIDLEDGTGTESRLFTESVERVRGTYTFSARSFLRLIVQRQTRDQDPALFAFPVPAEANVTSGSLLYAYKLNWQSVLFLGYGDERAWSEESGDLELASRSLFFKVSYAFQH